MISDNLKPATQVAKVVTKANQVLTRAFHYRDKCSKRNKNFRLVQEQPL